MPDRKDERHRYGQHYTPDTVGRLLAALAVRSAGDLVLDPSCGDGRLLEQAIKIKECLARKVSESPRVLSKASAAGSKDRSASVEVFGVDRSAEAVDLASARGARAARADFFELQPGVANPHIDLPGSFDAILGNPPYIRQELMELVEKAVIRERLNGRQYSIAGRKVTRPRKASGRERGLWSSVDDLDQSRLFIPEWSGRSDIYVYFFFHAARFLRPGGRLVFITSSSWLDAAYGAALQEFMLRNFRIIAVLESGVESFFDQASVNTTITVLERDEAPESRAANRVRFIQLLAPLNDILTTPMRSIHSSDIRSGSNEQGADGAETKSAELAAIHFARRIEGASPGEDGPLRVRVVEQKALFNGFVSQSQDRLIPSVYTGPGWGKHIRADDVFFQIMERGSTMRPLSQMAGVRFGVKTGANEFFYLKRPSGDQSAPPGGLRLLNDLATVRRGMTTGANEFFYVKTVAAPNAEDGSDSLLVEAGSGRRVLIESAYLRPVVFSLKEIPRIVLDDWTPGRFFFCCSKTMEDLAGTAALSYIQQGEQDGYNTRRTCAARNPWYALARGLYPAPLLFPSKVGERWLVAINKAGVFEDKKLYGVVPAQGCSVELLAALLNSTWARYYTEMTCRQMTGAQAIADIDVAVAERISLPAPQSIPESLKVQLVDALDTLAARPVGSLFKEVECPDRRELDRLVLAAIGFDDEAERDSVLEEMYRAVVTVVRSRITRAANTKL